MPVELLARKSVSGGALVPCTVADRELLDTVPKGVILKLKITIPRNLKFHRKGFALFTVLYELWSETLEAREFHGREVLPEFNRFRRDMTIAAGFFRPVFNTRGEIEFEAESLNFGNMDDARFALVYSAVLDVGMRTIASRLARDDIESAVDKLMGFA